MIRFFIFSLICFSTFTPFCQKEVDFVREIHCEKVTGYAPAGIFYSEYYHDESSLSSRFKMSEYQNGELYSSDFDWYSEDLHCGLSYGIHNEDEENSFSFSWQYLDPNSGVYSSFFVDIFNGELDVDSKYTRELDGSLLSFQKDYPISDDLIIQCKKFVEGHSLDTSPFEFIFPMFDFGPIELATYSWESKGEIQENKETKFIEIDSILIDGNYQVTIDSFIEWDNQIGKRTIHNRLVNNRLSQWEGGPAAPSWQKWSNLSQDGLDTTYSLEIKRILKGKGYHQDITESYFLSERSDDVAINRREIHIEYGKNGLQELRECKAITMDGQVARTLWGKKLKEGEKIHKAVVFDSTNKSYTVETYPTNLQNLTYWRPYRVSNKTYRQKKNKFSKKWLKQMNYEKVSQHKSKELDSFVFKESDHFFIIEVYYK